MADRFLLAFVNTTDSIEKGYILKQCLIVLAVVVLYAIDKVIVGKSGVQSIFFSGYFTDVLAPFALFGASNAVFSLMRFRVIRLAPTLFLCALAGLAWELLAPIVVSGSVSDPFDWLAYMVGGTLYWLCSSRSLAK